MYNHLVPCCTTPLPRCPNFNPRFSQTSHPCPMPWRCARNWWTKSCPPYIQCHRVRDATQKSLGSYCRCATSNLTPRPERSTSPLPTQSITPTPQLAHKSPQNKNPTDCYCHLMDPLDIKTNRNQTLQQDSSQNVRLSTKSHKIGSTKSCACPSRC